MHEYIFFDGAIITAGDAAISPLTMAALYGKGVFTTVAIVDGKPFLWEKHWRRLASNAEEAATDLTEYLEDSARSALDEIVKKNGIIKGRARVTFFAESASNIWPIEKRQTTSLLITTGDMRPVSDNFRLTISPYRINTCSPLAAVKSCNYLENLLAFDQAKQRGFDEAIQMNERSEITSATMANVFWLKDNMLHTPSLKTGCLAGTTREFVLENLDCREVEQTFDTLHTADAIFLSSAGLGVVQVSQFETRKLAWIDHPVFGLLPK